MRVRRVFEILLVELFDELIIPLGLFVLLLISLLHLFLELDELVIFSVFVGVELTDFLKFVEHPLVLEVRDKRYHKVVCENVSVNMLCQQRARRFD